MEKSISGILQGHRECIQSSQRHICFVYHIFHTYSCSSTSDTLRSNIGHSGRGQDSHRSYFEQKCRNPFDRPNRLLGKNISGNFWVNRVHRIRSVGSKTHFGHLCNPDNGLERRSQRRMGVCRSSKVGNCSRNSPLLNHKKHKKLSYCNPDTLPSCISDTILLSLQSNHQLRYIPCIFPGSNISSSFPVNIASIALKR